MLLVLLVVILIAAVLVYDSNTRIVATEYELFYPNLPAAFDGYRIVVLSDIHAAEFGKGNERLITEVKEAKPDIIAITGDFIDGYKKTASQEQLDIAGALAKSLKPIAPIYFVTGNHDWDSGAMRTLISLLEAHDVLVLRNSFTRIEAGGESIILVGTDDPNGPSDMMKPDELIEKVRAAAGGPAAGSAGDFIVVLEHRNNHLQLYSELGVDLVLCGHAHGGIIRLPFTDGVLGQQRDLFPTYTNGVYTSGDTNMVVSRGLGNSLGIPRFLNNPHIVVAVLRIG